MAKRSRQPSAQLEAFHAMPPAGRYSVEKLFIYVTPQQLNLNTCMPPASRMRRSGQERTPIWRPLFFLLTRCPGHHNDNSRPIAATAAKADPTRRPANYAAV